MTYELGSIHFTVLTSCDIFSTWKIKFYTNRRLRFFKILKYSTKTKENAIQLWRNEFPDENRYSLISITRLENLVFHRTNHYNRTSFSNKSGIPQFLTAASIIVCVNLLDVADITKKLAKIEIIIIFFRPI